MKGPIASGRDPRGDLAHLVFIALKSITETVPRRAMPRSSTAFTAEPAESSVLSSFAGRLPPVIAHEAVELSRGKTTP